MDTKMKQQANRIESIRITFVAPLSTVSQYINIPFEVKKMRVVSCSYSSTAGIIPSYITIDLPKLGSGFIGYLDSISSTKTFEYVFDSPITIQGTYTFTMYNILTGIPTLQLQDVGMHFCIEFIQ